MGISALIGFDGAGVPLLLPPAFIFFAGALLALFLRGPVRSAALLLTVAASSLYTLSFEAGTSYHHLVTFWGGHATTTLDRLSLLFGYLFHLAALIALIFSLHVKDTRQHVAGMVYAGSALGAVFAGDLITLFVYWELVALSSTLLIWLRDSERSRTTALRYFMVHMTSGVLLLAGAALYHQQTGSWAFTFIGLEGLAGWLIFIAFGIKCAFPFLHNWLTDSYPESTPTGTVFLSAFTTKVGVYALARGYPGTELLIYIGALMTFFPIFYAVIENDLRRVLSYSMINQLGFMVVGIGIGTALAINGAVSHAFNDVIFKALLFMSMGAVLHVTGKINGTDLGGLYKTIPVTTVLCIVGAASISAFPLFSGFVSKSMVMAAAIEEGYDWIWLVLLFASAGVFHHAGIKIPYFAFFARDSGLRVREPPWNMLLAMAIAAALCVFNGAYPWLLYSLLPYAVDYVPYTTTHVVTQLQLLFFSALAFAWLMLSGIYPPEKRSVNLDAEWVYRKLAPRVLGEIGAAIDTVDREVRSGVTHQVREVIAGIFRHHGPQGILARTWPTGSTVLWVAVILGAYLIFSYLR